MNIAGLFSNQPHWVGDLNSDTSYANAFGDLDNDGDYDFMLRVWR